jgi:uncharacterized protein (DUF1015 family)
MVEVLPLSGLFYNKDKIRSISDVISPPYDVIPKPLRKKLYNLDPYNIINLILPRGRSSEKYKNAQKILENWTKNKILIFDDRKYFYVFKENFSADGKRKNITGFIGLTKIEPYSSSNIIPHEKTQPKPKKDRLNLLNSCRTNFGLVYTLYRDHQKSIVNILKKVMKKKPFINTAAGYDPSLNFKIWKISETQYIKKIVEIMKDKKLIIADGHHRYETSLIYKKKRDSIINKVTSHPEKTEDYILTLYIESSSKDIFVHPNHRLIKFNTYPGIDNVLEKIKKDFSIEPVTTNSHKYIKKRLLDAKSKGIKSFFIYSGPEKLYFITLKPSLTDTVGSSKADSGEYLNIDINILKRFLIEKLTKQFQIKKISYTHYITNAIKKVNNSKFDLGIFLNAPTVKEIEKISALSYILPDKSTYFYPKPCTGLIMYKFDRYSENPF